VTLAGNYRLPVFRQEFHQRHLWEWTTLAENQWTHDGRKLTIDEYPDISTWILAGHSLGGASAAIFAENNPTRIDAIAFWDSYPPDSADLSDNAISALSVFGTTNDSPNTDNLNDKRHLLPANTVFVGIEGASHAQFGDYGPQKGDVVASISLAEQHDKVAEIMLDFITQNQ
jgi:predicted alpha/beta-hydrolase family hydrolase